ncbi:MAG: hypothetical protein GC149_01325 [Gammaproteobacteria bacterium]|nr:hypothetical protein [Gammaproteobacteria bacterium]
MSIEYIQIKSGARIPKSDIHNVCFLFWGLIGDVFIRVSILETFKKFYPNTRITVIVDPPAEPVLRNHPDVDEVYVFDRKKKPRIKYFTGILRNSFILRRKRFDLFVNLYSGGSSPLVTRLVNARIRLGFDHTANLRRVNNLLVKHPSLCLHWTRQFATILIPLGIANSDVRKGTSFYCDDKALSLAQAQFSNDSHEYIAVNLGARVAEKRWSISRYIELCKILNSAYGLCPMVLTNPGMEELASQFCEEYAAYGHSLKIPLLPLNDVAAVMLHAKFVITGDTSIMHLSFGLKLPTLVLFTYTRPEIVAPDDCLHEDCFIPNENNKDECGNPFGSNDIPVSMAVEKFEKLYTRNSRSS